MYINLVHPGYSDIYPLDERVKKNVQVKHLYDAFALSFFCKVNNDIHVHGDVFEYIPGLALIAQRADTIALQRLLDS